MSWRLYQQHTEPVQFGTTPVPEQWLTPWRDPVRRAGIVVALIASGAVISPWALTQPEAVTADRWVQPFSLPPIRKTLPTYQQQSLAFVAPSGAPEVITADKWFNPLSDPLRARLSLPVYDQQFLAFVKAAPFPETTTADRWLQPFGEPKRIRWPIYAAPSFVTVVETVTTDKWFASFSLPVRSRPGLRADEQTAFTIDPLALYGTVSRYGWFEPLSEPVRIRPALRASQQFVTAFVHAPALSFAWHVALAEPVRFRRPDLNQVSPGIVISELPPPPNRIVSVTTSLGQAYRVTVSITASSGVTGITATRGDTEVS